jgi:hypothetical protein
MGSRTLVASTRTYYYNLGASTMPASSHPPPARHAPSPPLSIPWRSTAARNPHANVLRLALEPRLFDELEMERKILQDALNQIDERARSLVKELAAVDQVIQQASDGKRREAESQYGKLKSQMVDTVEEEKSIWLHLAELHIEIQSRERWCAVWEAHEHADSWPEEHQSAGKLQAAEKDKGAGTEDNHTSRTCSLSPSLITGAGHNTGAEQAHISNPFETHQAHQTPENINSTSMRVYKRNSLPSLRYVWAGTSNEAGHTCSGYAAEG